MENEIIRSLALVQNVKLPVPHLEQPTSAGDESSFRVSFLGEQTIQAAHTIFLAQPSYIFATFEGACII